MRVSLFLSMVSLFAIAASTAKAALPRHCASNDSLAAAASSLLLGARTLSPTSIRDALRDSDSDLPGAYGLRVRLDDEAHVGAWFAEQERIADAPLECGEATNSRERVILVAARAGSLERDGVLERLYRIHLHASFHHPRVVVLDAAGVSRTVSVAMREANLVAHLPEDLSSPYLLQLVADGPHGPRPLAERRVGSWSESGPSSQAPMSLHQRLDSLRSDSSAASLRENRLLTRAATRHAHAVCESGVVAHTLSPGADPESRLRREGIVARVVGETVARSIDDDAAFDSFLASPSHRAALNDPRFTDVGIASVADATGQRCVVIMLAAWPRLIADR